MYVASMGAIGSSGLTITPSARIVWNRFVALSAPIGSPTPTIPADSVESSKLSVSELINTSLHGQMPSAEASSEAYKKVSQRALLNRSPLTRIVVRLLYILLCRKWRGNAIQYCIVSPALDIPLAMLFIKASDRHYRCRYQIFDWTIYRRSLWDTTSRQVACIREEYPPA